VIKYACDWCQREFPLNEISAVRVKNVYNKPVRLHICWDCGKVHMPERARSSLSWTSP
jgi:uncharacterized protein YlaI